MITCACATQKCGTPRLGKPRIEHKVLSRETIKYTFTEPSIGQYIANCLCFPLEAAAASMNGMMSADLEGFPLLIF